MGGQARGKVRAILGCDVHSRRLFFSQSPEEEPVPALFDAVTCIFCLGYASTSEQDYRSGVANIARKVCVHTFTRNDLGC